MANTADAVDRARRVIVELVEERGSEKTICPPEAARVLAGDRDFRGFMASVREAAGTLAERGRVELTQKGRQVSIAEAHGPVRIGLRERS